MAVKVAPSFVLPPEGAERACVRLALRRCWKGPGGKQVRGSRARPQGGRLSKDCEGGLFPESRTFRGALELLASPALGRMDCELLFHLIFQIKVRGGGGVAKSLNLEGGPGSKHWSDRGSALPCPQCKSWADPLPFGGSGPPSVHWGDLHKLERGLESGVTAGVRCDSPPFPGSFSPPGHEKLLSGPRQDSAL